MKYRYVGIPQDLHEEMEKIVDESSLGYRSIAEFVRDAVRRRIETYERDHPTIASEAPGVEQV